jgi:HEAT repeat protein
MKRSLIAPLVVFALACVVTSTNGQNIGSGGSNTGNGNTQGPVAAPPTPPQPGTAGTNGTPPAPPTLGTGPTNPGGVSGGGTTPPGVNVPTPPTHPPAPPSPGGVGTGAGAGGGNLPPTGGGGPRPGVAPGGGGVRPNPGRPGGGSTGPGFGGAPSAPGPGGAGPAGIPGSGNAPGGATGGRKKARAINESRIEWGWWWAYNNAVYFNVREAQADALAVESSDIFHAEAMAPGEETKHKVDRIRASVVPFLRTGITDPDADVRAQSLIALGKCGDGSVTALLLHALADQNPEVREAGALALGILSAEPAVAALIEVLNDSPDGRRLVGREAGVYERLRAHAALGLGLAARYGGEVDPRASQALRAIIAQRNAQKDVPAAAMVALGFARDRNATPDLIAYLRSSEDDVLRGEAACALGRIGDRSAVKALHLALEDPANHVRRSAAIALGAVATPHDHEVLVALRKRALEGDDRAERNFAIIALGRIGGLENAEFLHDLAEGREDFASTFGALGLALAVRRGDIDHADAYGAVLHRLFRERDAAHVRGAYAIALGLAGYERAAADIAGVLDSKGDPSLRAQCAQALGLLRARSAIPQIRAALLESNEPEVRLASAQAIGLIGDREAIDVLTQSMFESDGNVVLAGTVLRGLGLVGDGTIVALLGETLRSGERPNTVRAEAAVALGVLADRSNTSQIAQLGRDDNYVSHTGALRDLLARSDFVSRVF